MGMMSKTYGDKPLVFAFDGDGEEYMIGSEVGNYLRLFRGALYKKFPGLARRNLTNDERRKLIDMGHSQHVTSSTISLLLAREVEDLLAGRDDQFKGNAGNSDTPKLDKPKVIKPPAAVAAMPNSSHLDAVPQPTPINRNRVLHKNVRTFPLCFDDTDPVSVHENATLPEVLVPIRLDMDIEGQKLRDTFCWNKNETLLSPDQFAEVLCLRSLQLFSNNLTISPAKVRIY